MFYNNEPNGLIDSLQSFKKFKLLIKRTCYLFYRFVVRKFSTPVFKKQSAYLCYSEI